MPAKLFWKSVCLIFIIVLLAGCSQAAPAALPTTAPPVSPTAAEPILPAPTAVVPTETTAPAQADSVPAQADASQPWQVTDLGRIQFQPNSTGWYTHGDLASNTASRFVLSAMKGQQMTVWLATGPDWQADPQASLYITGADGQIFTPNPTFYWSSVLPSGQDYFIEVRSMAQEDILYQISVDIPAVVIDPALGDKYEPVDASVCQLIQEVATQVLGVEFNRAEIAPFLDTVAGEAGQGCRLSAGGDGNQFASPQSVVEALTRPGGLGWTELPAYQADGPTGSAAAMTRDMGLMLIQANWKPAMGVVCPADQPVSDCSLTPEQKIYLIQIDVAQYRADFSLDGHWEDAAGFSLDLYQDWKILYGHHTVVAQNGSKIDTLDVSINGSIQGQGANVQFQSSFTQDPGEAQITVIDVNTISWKITKAPDGEYYLPAEATLTRK